MSGNEDEVPELYPYYWSSDSSSLGIEQFVGKFKPSMVQDDGTKPWLWVRNSNPAGVDSERNEAVEEATSLLTEITEKVEKIKNDDKIPTRSNKKTGAKSKKEFREQIQLEAAQKLREIHISHGFKTGKWLIFVPPDKVDSVWYRIAISTVTGPLSETSVSMAKVATTPAKESSAQRVICIYMPDVFDQEKVTEVMRILLRNHGVNLSGVKSNLYTEIGLDSKHPSGIQSTVWKNTALLKEVEIKELKDEFFTGLKTEQEKGGLSSKPKKLTEKSKMAEDDPFASDDDEELQGEAESRPKPKLPVGDPFGSSDEDQSKGKPTSKSQNKVSKRKKPQGGDEEEQEKPTKAQKKS